MKNIQTESPYTEKLPRIEWPDSEGKIKLSFF